MNKILLIHHQKSLLLVCMVVLAFSSVTASAYISTLLHSGNRRTTDTPAVTPSTGSPTHATPSSPRSSNNSSDSPTGAAQAPGSATSPLQPTAQGATSPTATQKLATNNSKSSSSSVAPPIQTQQCPAGYSGTYPSCTAPVPVPYGISGAWQLIMQDEFNGSSLNTAMWTPQRGPSYSYGDPYNPQYEDAYYLANNPKVQNGSLVLTLNQGATNGYPYSSGMVQNGRNFSYKYGYLEARIKVPGNTGVWPAFWTLSAPVDQSWPPEIDVFEFGLQGQTRPTFNYHYGSSSNPLQSGIALYGNSSINYTQDYHIYGLSWSANKIQVYLDGVAGPSYTTSANITALPQYVILNLGLKKGYTVPSGTAMYVDYVRVWQ